MYNKQTIIVGALALIIGIAGGWYSATKFNVNKKFSTPFTQEQNQGGYARGGGMMNGGNNQQELGDNRSERRGRMQSGGQGRGGMLLGEVIAKDDKSITVKTIDGGSKIIFYSDTTTINTSISGSASDLTVGKQVRVNGPDNADGSVAAQNIQISQGQ